MDTATTTTESASTRPDPIIIRVLPPKQKPYSRGAVWVSIIILGVSIVSGIYVHVWGEGMGRGLFPMIVWLLSAFTVIQIVGTNRSPQKRDDFVRSLPESRAEWDEEPWASMWRSTNSPPSADELVQATLKAGLPSNRALVFCVGFISVPKVDEARFEPVVIPMSSFLWPRVVFALVAFAMVAGWALQVVGILPGPRWSFGAFVFTGAGIALLGSMIWRASLRPRYIRVAPGIVQILNYEFQRKKPTVRDYPIESGTTVIVSDLPAEPKLQLVRGELRDVIPISAYWKPTAVMERIWPALLSTAPTPPLSDAELLG